MSQKHLPRQISLACTVIEHAEHRWQRCRAYFTDAVRRVPDTETLFPLAQNTAHCQCCLFEAILFAAEVRDAVIDFVETTSSGRKSCLDRTHYPVAAQRLLRFDGRAFARESEAPASHGRALLRVDETQKNRCGRFSWNKSIGISARQYAMTLIKRG